MKTSPIESIIANNKVVLLDSDMVMEDKGFWRKFMHPKNFSQIYLFPKNFQEYTKQEREFISILKERKKVLKMNLVEKGIYDGLKSNEEYLKYKENENPDKDDFLIAGATISQTRGKTSLISKKSNIENTWRLLINEKPNFFKYKLDLYLKVEENKYHSINW